MPDRGRDIRVLVIAEQCNPEWTSVPLVGWGHASALLRQARGTIATSVRNREALIRAGMKEGSDFIVVDSEAVDRKLWWLAQRLRGGAGRGWTTITAAMGVSYYWFEHVLWRDLGPRIRAGEWDVVHRITPLSPTTPSLLARKCARAGVPFVVGPVNGGVAWPKGFGGTRRAEREWLSYLRGAHRLMPGASAMRRHAAAMLIGSRDTLALEGRGQDGKSFYIPENAVDPARFGVVRTRRVDGPLRLAFAGRLVPYKGCDMLLEAAAPLLRAGRAMIEIIGDGPQRPALDALLAREQVGHGVTFAGWVDHTALPARLIEHDLFAFPSIREFGGGVVLEAMAVGLVPAVVDYGGPGELVTEETGYRIPLGTRGEIVARYRSLLERLVERPWEIELRSAAARQRVLEHFTWDRKAADSLEVYRWALGTGPKPRTAIVGECPAARVAGQGAGPCESDVTAEVMA